MSSSVLCAQVLVLGVFLLIDVCTGTADTLVAHHAPHAEVYGIPHHEAEVGESVDRSLHVRSLPPVEGYQSNLYEIYMEPYAYGIRPSFASALLEPNTDNPDDAAAAVRGELVFTQPHPPTGPITIQGNITGLTPGKHGLHIHEFGDLRKSCTSVGGHFNPFKLQHGGPHDPLRHLGDLGNIEAGEDGIAQVKVLEHLLSLNGAHRNIVGRAIVVHAAEDDLGRSGTVDSITSGSSGARLACGIIGIIN